MSESLFYRNSSEDSRIQHFQVRSVDMDTQPAMPVRWQMGWCWKKGRSTSVYNGTLSLAVMAGNAAPDALPRPPEIHEARTHATG